MAQTPLQSKRTFSAAELSPDISTSQPLSTKKLNMSLDVDTFLNLLNDERIKSVFKNMFLDAISQELKSRDDKIAALKEEVKDLKTELHDIKMEKMQEREHLERKIDEQEQYSQRNNLKVFAEGSWGDGWEYHRPGYRPRENYRSCPHAMTSAVRTV